MHSETSNLAIPTAASESHIKYRRDIDGLRALAVIAVLLFHAFPSALTGGFVGVDVFFVISGFLITKVIATTLDQGTFSIVDFYSRRVRRIFPALTLVLLVCLAVGWQMLVAEDLVQLAKHIVGGATFSSNLMLWQEAGYFDAASETKPLLHLWSLGIEEQFYIVWPLLMWLGARRRLSPLTLIGITALVSFSANVAGITNHPTATFYSPVSRAWELLFGAALAFMPPHVAPAENGVVRQGASVIGIVLVIGSAVMFSPSAAFPGWWALLPVLGTCLAIWAGPDAVVNRHFLSHRALVGVGLISFPLYLWHWPLLTIGSELTPELGRGVLSRSLLLSISVLLAWLTYQYMEKPLRFGTAVRAKVYGLSGAMLVIACMAAALVVARGAPSRYPDVIQHATRYDLNAFHEGMRWKRCFLEFGEGPTDFAPECVDKGARPLVLVWGDSTAAAIFPGLRSMAEQAGTFRLAQFTSSGCAPLLGRLSEYRPACPGTNDKAMAAVRELQPQVVVLAANWQIYETDHLQATIAALRGVGVRRVVVMGPGLVWNFPPSRIVLRQWRMDPLHRVPSPRLDYKQYGLYEQLDNNHAQAFRRSDLMEATLQRITVDAGGEFISLLKALCNADGCLMRAPDSGYSFFLDTAHLNPNGADFLVKAIAPQLKLGSGSAAQ